MFEYARHFPGRRGHASNSHDRMAIDFQDFVGTIVDNRGARRRASIARHQHAAGKFESKNCSRLCRLEGFLLRRPTLWRWIKSRCWSKEALAPQQRGKIVCRARKILVKRHRERLHYWPVRWR